MPFCVGRLVDRKNGRGELDGFRSARWGDTERKRHNHGRVPQRDLVTFLSAPLLPKHLVNFASLILAFPQPRADHHG